MNARDVMTTPVITVSPETPVADVAALLLERRISGVPVVDGGRLLGVVSEGDLMRRVEIGSEERTSWWLRHFGSLDRMADTYVRSHGKFARDVMTTRVITVTEDTTVSEIAQLLETKRIKRVPVVRGDEVVGIVSRANLLHAIAAGRKRQDPGVRPDDAALRSLIVERVHGEPWTHAAVINVTVDDGVAVLWGLVHSPIQRDALRVLAEGVEGVRAVEVNLELFDPRSPVPD